MVKYALSALCATEKFHEMEEDDDRDDNAEGEGDTSIEDEEDVGRSTDDDSVAREGIAQDSAE